MLLHAVLRKLLEFATKKSHFLFDGQYYDQIDGVAMGSPLDPVLANIFMCHFKERWVMNGKVCPLLWYRYVDDTFTMFDSKNTANEFLQYLNSCHNGIKFNIEFEQDNEIPFLDILVKRCPINTFMTFIYRKKTFTGLYTKWDSFTVRKYKINLIRISLIVATEFAPLLLCCNLLSLILASKTSASKWLPSRYNHLQP